MPDVKFSNQYPYTDFHELNLDWVIDTVKHWSELVGKTIQSITLTGTTGLVDTYTINYSDGTTSTFTVTNGRGITSIALTGSLGLVDTYTITYNDGSTSTFQLTNGNGISSIEKTGTSGLIDTYTITFTDGSSTTFEVKNGAEAIDATLTQAGYAADAKAVGDALDLKQNKDEPIALAENLTPYSPDSGVTQDQPFILQGTGTGNGESMVDTGSYAQIKKKLGNTVCVNQFVPDAHSIAPGTYTWTGIFGNSLVGKELIKDHYYLIFVDTPEIIVRWRNETLGVVGSGGRYVVYKPTTTDNHYYVQARGALTSTAHLKWIDISRWYGSFDRIPAHLLSHPEDWGKYYSGSLAFNPGQLINADGSALTSIGRNIFDKTQTLTTGYLRDDDSIASSVNWKYTDYIAISPNTAYYEPVSGANPSTCFYDRDKNFIGALTHQDIGYNLGNIYTTPPNAYYLRTSIALADVDTYDISRYYAGESGYNQHYPYTILAQIDTGDEGLDGVEESRDEKLPNGTIIRRRATIDLGGLPWNYDNGVFYTTGTSATAKPQQNPMCSMYYGSADESDKTIFIGTGGITYVYDSYYSNVADFVDGMDGVMMNYDLITPTTEQGTVFSGTSADNFAINDFGSIFWNVTNGIPQGIEIFYPVDYKAAIDTLLNMVDGDVGKVVMTDTYPDVPATDGTYVLKASVSGGTVTRSWVLE